MKKISLSITTIFTVAVFALSTYSCSHSSFLPGAHYSHTHAIDNLSSSEKPQYVLDKDKLAELVTLITQGSFGNIHSLLIIHNDRLVLEEYFQGWNREKLHPTWSITKSITSALIGIAISQGKIEGVEQKLLSFFPEYKTIANLDKRKEMITLEHLLTMSGGFKWDQFSTPYFDDEGKPNPENDVFKMAQSSDWIKYVLDLPMDFVPGKKCVYSNGCTHLLSGILKNTTGQTAEEFAKENLFEPLDITKWEWEKDPKGLSDTGGGLFLSSADMAMFGYLYLRRGKLNGRQIVPERWVVQSTAHHIKCKLADYGYQWWYSSDILSSSEEINYFYAYGLKGQFIIVRPTYNMVVVTTGENKKMGGEAFAILYDYILPAVIKAF